MTRSESAPMRRRATGAGEVGARGCDCAVEPTLAEIRAVLDLRVEVCRPDPWGEAIAEQVRHLIGVSGPSCDTMLVVGGHPAAVPAGTPIPLSRSLETRLGVEPAACVLLWIDPTTGVISSVEHAIYGDDRLRRYPTPEDLTAWP